MPTNDINLVTIVMPSYNSASYIYKSIESIINQTFTDWELLITDDCSTDNTMKVLSRYQDLDKRIYVYQLKKNSGAGIARNNSIQRARGKFIAFCDSDDLWTPDKLQKQIPFMLKNDLALSYSNYYIINEAGTITGKRKFPDKVDYKKMLLNNYIGCSTAIYDSSKLGKMYMQDLKNRQDWLLWLDILKKTKVALNLNETVAYYTERSNSISSNKIKMMRYNWLIYRRYQKIPFIKSCYFIIRYILMYFKKIR